MAAADLARKLYTLDGIKKEAVAKHLSIKCVCVCVCVCVSVALSCVLSCGQV